VTARRDLARHRSGKANVVVKARIDSAKESLAARG